MPELGPYGSVRGALSNGRPYRDSGAPALSRSVPDTWVTVYTGDMGNTFGPKGFSIGSSLHVW